MLRYLLMPHARLTPIEVPVILLYYPGASTLMKLAPDLRFTRR
jgi:hypothetical protein